MIRQIALMVLLIGWTLCAAPAQQTPAEEGNPAPTQDAPKTPPTAQKQANKPKQEEQKDKAPLYYDRRERIAATLTLEWADTSIVTLTERFIYRQNESIRMQAEFAGVPPEKVIFINKEIANQPIELSGHHLIERTPKITRIKRLVQALSFPEVQPVLSQSDTYFLQNIVISVDYDLDGHPMGATLSRAEGDVWGLGESHGVISPAKLIFLAGISPLRMESVPLDRWQLKSVSPEKWVFTLKRQEEESYKPQIEIHLDRRYGDAPAYLEIRYSDGETRIWRTLKYKQIEGAWFPSEVEYIQNGDRRVWKKYVLVRATRTKSVEIAIPEGLRVRDYRRAGDASWEGSADYEETEWKPDLLGQKEKQSK
jgi:hypothetical protein